MRMSREMAINGQLSNILFYDAGNAHAEHGGAWQYAQFTHPSYQKIAPIVNAASFEVKVTAPETYCVYGKTLPIDVTKLKTLHCNILSASQGLSVRFGLWSSPEIRDTNLVAFSNINGVTGVASVDVSSVTGTAYLCFQAVPTIVHYGYEPWPDAVINKVWGTLT